MPQPESDNISSIEHVPDNPAEHASTMPPYMVFREHVEHVRKKGDSFDQVKPLESFRTQLAAPILGALAFSHLSTISGDSWPRPVLVTTAVNAASIGVLLNAVRNSNTDKRTKDAAIGAQDGLQEKYELWNIKNKVTDKSEVVMHWQGTYDYETADDDELASRPLYNSLRLVCALADDNDIKAVIVAPETLQKVPGAAGFATAQIDLIDWASEQKGTRLRVTKDNAPSKHPALVYSPTQLRMLTEHLEKQTQISIETQKSIAVLREYNPEHPIVRVADEYASMPELGTKKLTQIAKQCVERRLDDVAAIRTFSDVGLPERTKVHLSGWLASDNRVHWRHEGRYFDGSDLRGAGVEDARRVIEMPIVHPAPDVIRAAELLVAVNDGDTSQQGVPEKATAATVDEFIMMRLAKSQIGAGVFKMGPYMDFDRTEGDARKFWPTKYRRQILACGMLAASGTFLVATLLDMEVRDRHKTFVVHDQKAYAETHGRSFDSLSDKEKAQAAIMTQESHPLTTSYVNFRQAERDAGKTTLEYITSWIDGQNGAGESLPDPTAHLSNVGNVANPHDMRSYWRFETTGDIGTAGYWTQTVGDKLTPTGTWLESERKVVDHEEELLRGPDNIELPLIKVSGVTMLDKRQMATGLPILEGTDIVAASIGDKPVIKTVNKDGTISLRMNTGSATGPQQELQGRRSLQLTYWLQEVPDAPKTKFIPDAYLKKNDPMYMSGYYPYIRQAWADKIGSTVMDNSARLRSEVEYVKNHFLYEYEPLSEKQTQSLAGGAFNPVKFSTEQLKTQTANCNVAATLVAIDNPGTRPVWGFMNDGDNKLVQAEAHMWLTDLDGNRYDPTPAKMAVAKAAPESGVTFESLLARKEVMTSIGLAGLLLALRRPLRRRYARLALGRTSLHDLQQAEATIDNVLFSREFTLDARRLTERDNKEAYLAQLSQPAYHQKETRRQIRQAHKRTNDDGRQALNRAKRILSHVRSSRRIISPLAVDDVHSII